MYLHENQLDESKLLTSNRNKKAVRDSASTLRQITSTSCTEQ